MELRHPRYVAGAVLGRGAEGVVLRVRDREAKERALVAKLLGRDVDRARLEAEFALLSRVRAPGLVRVHDFAVDQASGRPFLVEDFVDGPDAAQLVSEGRDAIEKTARLVSLLASVARALDGLHANGFVHGDLKPAHVRVQGGRPVLLDLGAAMSGGFTRAFAAPEVIAGERSTVASDLYGLGATLHRAASGELSRAPLRAVASWVPPSVADVIDRLLAPHPRDRFASAADVVVAIARSHPLAGGEAHGTALVGRDVALAEIEAKLRSSRVLYVFGPHGAGKSHLAREAAMRARLRGEAVRAIEAAAVDAMLLRFLRGGPSPFEGECELLVIDDLDRGGAEIAAAIEAHRCSGDGRMRVLVTSTRVPDGAEGVEIGPLSAADFAALCRALDVPGDEVAELSSATGGLPGWLLAARGRAPLTREAAMARMESASPASRRMLAVVSSFGGSVDRELARTIAGDGESELFVRGLLVRSTPTTLRLAAPALAADLADAFADGATSEAVARAALVNAVAPATLLSLSQRAPTQRRELLSLAAERARATGAHAIETRALTALAEDGARDDKTLRRLERLARDASDAALHERAIAWLDDARSPSLEALSLARKAERAARAGDRTTAKSLLDAAFDAARALDDVALAHCEAARGTIALYGADWAAAERALTSARARLSGTSEIEELARVDHNLGVVSLYRGDAHGAIAAFERAIATKRALGDLPGVRASLLNLGLTCTRARDFHRGARVLEEALALARSLGERTGRAWTLAALAELHVRSGAVAEGERFVAETEACGDALPSAVRADLVLLRAEIALEEGDARRARSAIASVDGALREEDALLDARALTLEARAALNALPSDRRRAARLAVAALRRARAGGLPEAEEQARAVLTAARTRADTKRRSKTVDVDVDAELWRAIAAIARETSADGAALVAARAIVATSGAERAFVARVREGNVVSAWGADAEGFPLAAASERLEGGALKEVTSLAVRNASPVHFAGEKGARVAYAEEGTLVVAEHRYAASAFERVREETVRRWAALAALTALFERARPVATRDASPAKHIERVASEQLASDVRATSHEASHDTTVVPTVESRREFAGILGESPALRRALAKLESALDGELPVLIVGETGVGKELFARALHDEGPRARAPFVAVNCAAIPDSLFEAELFGHVRGSFTGADRARSGLASRARGGTLFLDEIGELPPARQATLLRVLETKRYRPVGSDEELPLDARIVSATNVDLARAAEDGRFRRDLLYRLDVVSLRVPPLRERKGDVALLLHRLLPGVEITRDALEALDGYHWPGNVRELVHLAQRLSLLRLRTLERAHLPRELRAGRRKPTLPARGKLDERGEVEAALDAEQGNITRAAARLGLTRHGLKKRMIRLGMRAPREAAG